MTAYDDFAEPGIVTLTGGTFTSATVSNVGFTDDEVGEPEAFSFGYRGAWWMFTPDADIDVAVDTSPMGPSLTVLTVFTGATVDALDFVGYDVSGDNNPDWSLVSLALTGGTTYHIRVGALDDGVDLDYIIMVAETVLPPGSIELDAPPIDVTAEASGPLDNDLFSDAYVVTIAGDGGTYISPAIHTLGLSVEAGEVTGATSHSAWWVYTPLSPGPVVFDTELSASGADTLLTVYTGTSVVGLYDDVSYDDDSGTGLTSRLVLGVNTAEGFQDQLLDVGTTYHIRVATFDGDALDNAYVLRVTGPHTDPTTMPPIDVEVRFLPVHDIFSPPGDGNGLLQVELPVPEVTSFGLTLISPAAGNIVPVSLPVFMVALTPPTAQSVDLEVQYAADDAFTSPVTLTATVELLDGVNPIVTVPALAPLSAGGHWWRARATYGTLVMPWRSAVAFTVDPTTLTFTNPITWTVAAGTALAHLWLAAPAGGVPGDQVVLLGQGLGDSAGAVRIGDLDATVSSWDLVADTGATTSRRIDALAGTADCEHTKIVIAVPAVPAPGAALVVEV
jgi:hypothetical protein